MAEKEYTPTFYERCLLHAIIIMTKRYGKYYQTNDTIADMFGMTENSVSVMISHLITNGYITKTKCGGKRYLSYTGKKFLEIPLALNFNKLEAVCAMNKCKRLEKEVESLKKENEELKKKLSV